MQQSNLNDTIRSDDAPFEGTSAEEREILESILAEYTERELQRLEEELGGVEIPSPSKRSKIQINRLFRERVGGSSIPFPEVDNRCERIRSALVVKLKINRLLDRFAKRKRAK